jgi:hypothetical protein
MKTVFAGLGMIGAALAASKSKGVSVHIIRMGNGAWSAVATGDGTEFLSPDKRMKLATSGHRALKELAEGWSRAGFLE